MTIQDLEDVTKGPLKRTDLVKCDYVVSLH